MKKTTGKQKHHLLYQENQRKALRCVWDNTTVELDVECHKEITSLQRRGVPPATTIGKIELDKMRGKI